MRIGLIDIEPKIVNTAYMQISTYHKNKGDTVEWWSPLTDRRFDYIYCSSIFDFTDKSEVPGRVICGGTGFEVSSRLSQKIETCDYDYSLYPECDYSIVWFSRGCPRRCPWCVVPEKEGQIQPVLPKPYNPEGKYVVVQDNNFFANPEWRKAIDMLYFWGQAVDFQGVDVRLLDRQKAEVLNSLRHYKQIKIAWDDPHQNLEPKLRQIIQWIKPYKLMCYVLIGFNSTEEQDLYRVETLRRLGIDPFVMPYNKRDLYQKAFARWVNYKAIFKSVSWNEYKKRVYAQEAAGNGWRN